MVGQMAATLAEHSVGRSAEHSVAGWVAMTAATVEMTAGEMAATWVVEMVVM